MATRNRTPKPSPYPPWQLARIGRPTTYNPAYCDQVLAHVQSDLPHATYAAIAVLFKAGKTTIEQWEADYPPFADALKQARAISEAKWSAAYAVKGLSDGKNLAQGYACFDMKNRFGWTDQRDVHMSGSVQHVHSPARQAYDQHVKLLAKANAIEDEPIEVEYVEVDR